MHNKARKRRRSLGWVKHLRGMGIGAMDARDKVQQTSAHPAKKSGISIQKQHKIKRTWASHSCMHWGIAGR
jgi:hypothetical protein